MARSPLRLLALLSAAVRRRQTPSARRSHRIPRPILRDDSRPGLVELIDGDVPLTVEFGKYSSAIALLLEEREVTPIPW